MLSSILQQIDRLCTKGSPGCHVYCVHKILYRCFFELSGANTNIPSFQGVSGARGHKDVYGLQWTHRLCKSASIPTRRRPPPLYRCILIQAHSTSIVHSRFHEMSFPRVAATCFVILLVHRMQAAVAGAPCVRPMLYALFSSSPPRDLRKMHKRESQTFTAGFLRAR